MFKQRIVSALVMIPIALGALFYFPEPYFLIAIAAISSTAMWEWGQMLRIKSNLVRILVAGLFFVLILSAGFFLTSLQKAVINHMVLSVSMGWWLAAIGLILTYPKSGQIWSRSPFLTLLFGFFILLPFVVGSIELRSLGTSWFLYVLGLVWASDTGAYIVGKKWGKHKLAPNVSPGKTWQGFGGALIFSSLLTLAFVNFKDDLAISTFNLIAISLITVIVSIFGDLAESMFKREANIKDSSNLIPGHGGVFDRIDSLTAAIPVFFSLYQLVVSHN